MTSSKNVFKKVRLLELKLRRKAKALLAGGYQSAFKGQGMVFTDYRKYIPGDDIRSVSWPLTAKMGKPYIKMFEEEKGATFIIVMDVSGSFDFGTHAFKGEASCEIASLIAMSAQRNQDRVGLILFSDKVEHYVPPSTGLKHTSRIVRDLYSFKRTSSQTDIVPVLDFLQSVLKKQCHIFLFSDFLTPGDFTKKMHITSSKHDMAVALVRDPFECDFPSLGLLDLEDAETHKHITIDTSSYHFKKEYQAMVKERQNKVEKQLLLSQADYFCLHTNKDLFKQFLHFIQKRRLR